MPRKRTRACAQINEIQNKFHCEEAKARYESIFKNQQMHPEKGFTLKESNYKDFMARIRQAVEALNWELFCEKRPSVDEELIREFYANLTSSSLIEVPVLRIKQRVEESEDPDEEEEDPTEIEPIQSAEAPDKVEPIEPEIEPDDETSIFKAQPPSPDFIFEPWSPLPKKERSNSCKGDSDRAKDESNSKGSANK
ncbi:hypothetical protein PVK06_001473 [Gossypium arboreum]|uniref:Uncharacterized protein n=1 Tax=Gossypium arboreum TaxID=29729 RepID=A0ABR0R2G1_GOSAR|nr:hypothetical protein PVK06_001473 [Gossypium arboreum]